MSTNLIGQILLDQFRVDSFIAAGGMGAVYRVWDLQRNVPLAMKVLHADLAEDPSVFKLFQREANALKKLTHPNIVPFYGVHQRNDMVFLLQHYVDGYSLKEILRQRKGQPLPVEEVLVYLKALSAALGYAHVNDVVHCDVKPGNVLIDRGGNVFLTDFGIARHAESTTTTIGAAGAPAYMAPEQIRAQPVTPPTDVYAMGVMLFEMLTGRRPFKGDEDRTAHDGATTGERIRIAHLTLSAPDPRRFNPSLPPALSLAVKKALAKEPGQRYPSMAALLEAACAAAGTTPGQLPNRVQLTGIPSKPPPTPPVQDGTSGVGPPPIRPPLDGPTESPKGKLPVSITSLALIAGGILVVFLIAYFGLNNNGPVTPTPGPTYTSTSSSATLLTVTPEIPETGENTDTPSATESVGPPPPDETPTDTPAPIPTTLTPTPTDTLSPTPSPTDTPTPTTPPPQTDYNLAFTSMENDLSSHIILMDAENPTNATSLPRPNGFEMVLWPSFCGERVAVEAYDSDGPNPQWIYMLYPDGRADSWLPPGSPAQLGVPRCSPDGNYLSYSANQSGNWLHTIADLANGNEILADNYGLSPSGYASWFPNSRDVLWMGQNDQDTFISLLTENLQISNTNQILPNFTDNGEAILQWRHPAISPFGDLVAFNCLVEEDDGAETTFICLAGFNSDSARKLFRINRVDIENYWEQVNPVWSGDGSWIYFNSADGGDWDIFRIRPDGSGLQNMTPSWNNTHEFHPATRW